MTALAAGFLLSSCQYGVSVSVSGSASQFIVDIRENRPGGEAAVFGNLSITTKTGDRQWHTLWWVNSAGSNCGPPTSRVVYGSVPKGFVANQPPEPLVEGIDYEVSVDGCGRIGGSTFHIEKGQVVSGQSAQNSTNPQ